jgi:membrane protease subunit HflC
MLTEDKENLNFQWYVCWRIPGREFVAEHRRAASGAAVADPSRAELPEDLEPYVRRFLQAVGTPQIAENRLEERIQAAFAAEIGRMRLGQLVSLAPEQLQIDEIARRVAGGVRETAAEQFGIEVVDVRLKRFSYPEAVKPAVYAEIRSERERVAVQYRAEGASEKAKIESLANLQRDQLLAQSQREATALRGQGEAKAIELANAAHGRNPAFYELLKTLEAYRVILDDRTTVVLSSDSPLLKLLTAGLPALPQKPAAPAGAPPPPAAPPPAASPAPPAGVPGDLNSAPASGGPP